MLLTIFVFLPCMAQTADAVLPDTETNGGLEPAKAGTVDVPSARKPGVPDPEKCTAAALKDEDPDKTFEKNRNTLKFGVSDEIVILVSTMIDNDDPRYFDDLYDLFHDTKSGAVREKIIEYFTHFKDPCLEDYAVTIANDPYDTSRNTVSLVIKYLAAVNCTESLPAIIGMLESEKNDYFDDAVGAIGDMGGSREALYLTGMMKNGDLTTARKQSLMRALGKIKAVETWPELSKIAQDSNENMFVRMYAAESIGEMKKPESIPVLMKLFEETDPNLRQYVIKGLSNYPDNKDAGNTIIQGIRDDYYKVRIESIKAAGSLKLAAAVPFLVYRADNDKEKAVQKECFPVIAGLDTKEGNTFLISVITDKKKGDTAKSYAADALIKNGSTGENEILALAADCLKDDHRKPLRYALGKAFVEYVRSSYADICSGYLSSKDETTVGIGLDMYRTGKVQAAAASVRNIADSSKDGNNQKTAKKLLGITDTTTADKNGTAKKPAAVQQQSAAVDSSSAADAE
jgi:HEAT repeat protein